MAALTTLWSPCARCGATGGWRWPFPGSATTRSFWATLPKSRRGPITAPVRITAAPFSGLPSSLPRRPWRCELEVYRGAVIIELPVNGERRRLTIRPGDTLLRTLRETLGLTGTKLGCENGDCGACTVLLDGQPVKSCLVLTLSVDGRAVTTIEGLRDTPVQQAFIAENGLQCGYCTPGMVLNAFALLASHPGPDDATVRLWMESNLCRCTGYEGVERAIRRAVDSAGGCDDPHGNLAPA